MLSAEARPDRNTGPGEVQPGVFFLSGQCGNAFAVIADTSLESVRWGSLCTFLLPITRLDPQGRLAPGGDYLAECQKLHKNPKKREKNGTLKMCPSFLKLEVGSKELSGSKIQFPPQ